MRGAGCGKTIPMSKNAPPPVNVVVPKDARVGIVAARFNAEIVDELLRRCELRLRELGLSRRQIETHHVPGAFELPVAAKMLIETNRVTAVICLGCVIRGDTPHFDFVAGEAARGIQNVASLTGMPIIFGVLTTNDEQQARERLDSGERFADAAMEMIALRDSISRARST